MIHLLSSKNFSKPIKNRQKSVLYKKTMQFTPCFRYITN